MIGRRCAGIILVLLIATLAPSVARQKDADDALGARIDALVTPQAAAGLVSGVILVVKGPRVLVRRSYGFANRELRVPNTPSSRLGIASLTKPLTETLVDLLARDGRVDLDAPVEHYLEGFPRGSQGGIPTIRATAHASLRRPAPRNRRHGRNAAAASSGHRRTRQGEGSAV